MSHANYIELEAAQLPVGEQMRAVCPACEGGSTHERSLLVTRELWGLRAHCFRATCTFHQRVNGAGMDTTSDVPTTPEPTHYFGTFEQLDAVDVAYFESRFHFTPEQGWIGYNAQNQYVMPILSRFGLREGFVVRQKPWDGTPAAPRRPHNPYSGMARKTRTWPDSPESVMLSIYLGYEGMVDIVPRGTIVLVEDQISAMKVADTGATGAALLGVGLNIDKVRQLQRLHPKRVLVALDPDASHLAFQMVNKWGSAFPSMRVALLDEDLKDMVPNDVLEVIGRGV